MPCDPTHCIWPFVAPLAFGSIYSSVYIQNIIHLYLLYIYKTISPIFVRVKLTKGAWQTQVVHTTGIRLGGLCRSYFNFDQVPCRAHRIRVKFWAFEYLWLSSVIKCYDPQCDDGRRREGDREVRMEGRGGTDRQMDGQTDRQTDGMQRAMKSPMEGSRNKILHTMYLLRTWHTSKF